MSARQITTRWLCAVAVTAATLWPETAPKTLTETACASAKLETSIPLDAIGEPVSAVTLGAPVWKPAADPLPAYCSIDGSMTAVETGTHAKPILFRVLLPASWSSRAAQFGGAGMNGMIPR